MIEKNKNSRQSSMLSITKSINNTINTNDVSFSIPDWRQQQIKSINQQYEKQIYTAVPLSLTDFDSKEQVQFLSEPQKCTDQKYAYERRLLRNQDFCILAFILCLEQLFIGDQSTKLDRLEKFKKKLNQLDLCSLTNIPIKMKNYYDNKIIKKILFQYINKGSYNVSLLQVLLRRNSVLKFSLSLVSKAILKKRGLITSYTQTIPFYVEMRNCGDQFGVMSAIKVRQKLIESENFLIEMQENYVRMLRKQNVVKTPTFQQIKRNSIRSSTPPANRSSKQISRKSTKQSEKSRQSKNQYELSTKQNGQSSKSKNKFFKRSNSLMNFVRKIICFSE